LRDCWWRGVTAQNKPFVLSEDQATRMATELAETASNPEFLRLMKSVQSAPAGEQHAIARNVARVDTLVGSSVAEFLQDHNAYI